MHTAQITSNMRYKTLRILVLIAIIVAIVLYTCKEFLLAKFKLFVINKIEYYTQTGIKIKDIGYIPTKGIHLEGITLYKSKLYKDEVFRATHLYIKFPFLKLAKERVFSPVITADNLKFKDTSVNGSLGFSIKLTKKIETPEDYLKTIQNIQLLNLSVKNAFFDIKDIKGAIEATPKSIKAANLGFILNGEPCKMDLEILDPLQEFSSQIKISSSKFNFLSRVNKEKENYKIPEIKGLIFNSSFEFMGELENPKEPVLSLYGKVDLDTKDIAYFAPPALKKTVETINPDGKVSNSIYFKGNLKDASTWEAGIKSNADTLVVRNLKLDNFYMDTRIKNGLVNVPILRASPYNGMLASSMQLDLTNEYMPYEVGCQLDNINIAGLLKNTELGKRDIRGFLFFKLAIKGNAKNIDSTEGRGSIFIDKANLGPMPLLTPLLGNLYGYFQHLFPGLKRVDITSGGCDFYIADRKVVTNNLTLWGEVVNINAKGYIDFDKNLNFEVENKFLEPEEAEKPDWQTSLQETITRFGKLMGKAYLTGTLEKPRWKFEYLSGIQNILKGGLDKILKDIFR